MILNTLIKRTIIPPDLSHLVGHRVGPLCKQISVFSRCSIIDTSCLSKRHKHNTIRFLSFGDLTTRINFLQHNGGYPFQSLSPQQVINLSVKGNARSLRLRAKNEAAIIMLLNMVRNSVKPMVVPSFMILYILHLQKRSHDKAAASGAAVRGR